MNGNARRINFRILMVGALLLFLGVELLIVIEFRKHRFDLSHDVFTSFIVYGIWFLTLSPGLVGLLGMGLVKRMLLRSDVTETAKQELTLQFVFGICVAYGALGLIMIMLQRLYRQ